MHHGISELCTRCSVGEKRKLKIPAYLGYGQQGSPPTIPGVHVHDPHCGLSCLHISACAVATRHMLLIVELIQAQSSCLEYNTAMSLMAGHAAPGGATLIFETELLSIGDDRGAEL